MMVLEFEHLLQASIGLDAASIGRSAVERAVRERQRACELGTAAYWDRVRDSEAELQALIDAVVVPETWFYRDRQAFDALAEFALTEWLPAHTHGTLRVLSLPSSSGEEPYSVAMTLLDAGLPPGRFAVDAIDVSERALAKAAHALFGTNSFRGSELSFRGRHFDAEASGHRLHERVRRQVQFRRGNICVADSLPGTAVYDVIFCRNLLIYFSRPTQDRAISLLERLLIGGGLLFVAPSEAGLILGRNGGWAKEGAGFRLRAPAPFVPLAPIAPRAPFAPLTPFARITALAPLAPTGVLEEATRLADQGRFAEAAARCERHLREHGPSATAFQLLGVLRDAAGDADDAMACYRKALYLDPNNQEVLIHLALLLERLDKKAEAHLLRSRERRVASRMAAS